jgi:sugar lactone lactonase YvrE
MKTHSVLVTALMIAMLGFISCGGGCDSSAPGLSSAKAITAFSFTSPAATGTIDENAKTISITVPYGTNVKALVATFTTNGANVKVGSTVQVSGTTPNDFTNLVLYTITAMEGTTTAYTVTVTVALTPAHIYVTDGGHNRIEQMDDMTGTGWTTLGTSGTGTNQFASPTGIFVGTDGRIYVADYNNNRIVRMDNITGAGWTTLGTSGTGTNQFSRPFNVYLDTAGKIYVTDMGNGRIVRMDDMNGTGWTTFGTYGTGTNQFGQPEGIFVDAAGYIYVADFYSDMYLDHGSHIVRINDMTGTGWTTLATRGTGTNLLQNPSGIFLDNAGKIYVTDTNNNQIVRVDDMTGTGWTTLGTPNSRTGINMFGFPVGIFVDVSGKIYVADSFNAWIVQIDDMTGTGWTTFGSYGNGTMQFNSGPGGIFLR